MALLFWAEEVLFGGRLSLCDSLSFYLLCCCIFSFPRAACFSSSSFCLWQGPAWMLGEAALQQHCCNRPPCHEEVPLLATQPCSSANPSPDPATRAAVIGSVLAAFPAFNGRGLKGKASSMESLPQLGGGKGRLPHWSGMSICFPWLQEGMHRASHCWLWGKAWSCLIT